MEADGVVLRVAGSTGFVVIGLIADASAVLLLALSSDVRDAAAAQPLMMILACGVLVLIALILLNLYSRTRATIQDLDIQIANLKKILATPVPADTARWAEFWEDFGRDSPLYLWLKDSFYISYAYEQEIQELDRVNAKWSRDPVKYYDGDVEEAFVSLRTSLDDLHEATARYYWYEHDPSVQIGSRRLSIPPEWDHVRKDEAVAAIGETWRKVMCAYDNLIRVAQEKKLIGSSTHTS